MIWKQVKQKTTLKYGLGHSFTRDISKNRHGMLGEQTGVGQRLNCTYLY